jgi:hypothetical protein
MSQEHLPPDPELTAVESALGSLAPARSRIDRDAVMYQAGRASARPAILGRVGWPAVAATLAALALGEAALLVRRPGVQVVERLVVVPASAVPSTSTGRARDTAAPEWYGPLDRAPGAAETDYERLCRQVVRYGLDALPGPPTVALRSGRRDDVSTSRLQPTVTLLRSEIDRLLNPGDTL